MKMNEKPDFVDRAVRSIHVSTANGTGRAEKTIRRDIIISPLSSATHTRPARITTAMTRSPDACLSVVVIIIIIIIRYKRTRWGFVFTTRAGDMVHVTCSIYE